MADESDLKAKMDALKGSAAPAAQTSVLPAKTMLYRLKRGYTWIGPDNKPTDLTEFTGQEKGFDAQRHKVELIAAIPASRATGSPDNRMASSPENR